MQFYTWEFGRFREMLIAEPLIGRACAVTLIIVESGILTRAAERVASIYDHIYRSTLIYA